MDDISLTDWPGASADLSVSNPWLPAYGFQQPTFQKDDFLGNPDAALFLNGNANQYVLLETILEETSDDLKSSGSERSASICSHDEDEFNRLGWLATDSENDSVIRVNVIDDDSTDSEGTTSECDVVCPAKRRRRHDQITNTNLLSVQTLQKSSSYHSSCGDDDSNTSMPSLSRSSSLLQFETLEKRCQDDNIYNSSPSILSTFSYDSLESQQLTRQKLNLSPDSLSKDSSDEDVSDYYRLISIDGKKDVESMSKKVVSSENLSEDSGYSDQVKSTPNLDQGFRAYDGESYTQTAYSFGTSYHDLSIFDPAKVNIKEKLKKLRFKKQIDDLLEIEEDDESLNLELMQWPTQSKNNSHSISVPNLLSVPDSSPFYSDFEFKSVPQDLNLASGGDVESVSCKNIDLCDLNNMADISSENNTVIIRLKGDGPRMDQTEATSKYADAIEIPNRTVIDVEHSKDTIDSSSFTLKDGVSKLLDVTNESYCYNLDIHSDIIDFEETLEKAISNSSIPSFTAKDDIDYFFQSTPMQRNNVIHSTPNLSVLRPEPEPPKNRSLKNGLSGSEGKNLGKGVHFCEIVSEVSWREASYSDEETLDDLMSKVADDVERDGVSHVNETDEELQESTHNNKHQLNVDATMEHTTTKPKITTKSTKKFGGFLSRFTNFRFSTRDKKKPQKSISAPIQIAPEPEKPSQDPNYIYIPLKVPDANKVLTKPPLPKLPPRVVGASVKTRPNTQTSVSPIRHIDSNKVVVRASGRHEGGLSRPTMSQQMGEPIGLIETDLDTHITVVNNLHKPPGGNGKARSLMNLGVTNSVSDRVDNSVSGVQLDTLRIGDSSRHQVRPHKSMEFLLDKQNLKVVEPPENELQKGTGERVMSEHQLRVQRSLQKLDVPEWFKQSQLPREGFLLKKQRDNTRWVGLSNKTTSLSSLSRQSPVQLSLSPQSANTEIGGFSRWSTSKLNSTASSPCNSTRSSFNYRQPINGSASPSARSSFNYRQPYLGWRSQERLTKPRTPAERLATTLLPARNESSSEIQSSIKEVTSAIVHYVSGLTPDDSNPAIDTLLNPRRDSFTSSQRSISPRGSQRICWLESSFVGTKPLDSPQTPMGIPTDAVTETENRPYPSLRLDLKSKNNPTDTSSSTNLARPTITRPSPGSTTLEDVLDSLLGLPPSTRAPSPSLQETVSASSSPGHLIDETIQDGLLNVHNTNTHLRRSSEGSSDKRSYIDVPRRVSFHVTPDTANTPIVIKCRNTKCTTQVSLEDARTYFKNCHNCNYTYCSRECRRAHWEKHRKTCLHSRASTLCRQVLAKAKDNGETLKYISSIARRGYLSLGPGVVKCFFPSPEAAERFIANGISHLLEPTYIRWSDLLPSEMGPELFSELVKICKNYNPDTRLVLYVAVCVVSEVPSTGTIKWERQLVSRCAKLRLSKDLSDSPQPITLPLDQPETLVLTTLPGGKNEVSVQKSRELSFGNIQRQLKQRGVNLKKSFPDVFQHLTEYVEGNCDQFTPITLYPVDSTSGKSFVCVITSGVEANYQNSSTLIM